MGNSLLDGRPTAVVAESGREHPTLTAPVGTSAPARGISAEHLSRQQARLWQRIVDVVLAERTGRPLHPTLRHLWDAVAVSPAVVFVEMPGPMACFTSRFEVGKADPFGRDHEATILLNTRAIDAAPTERHAAWADGFVPFRGLDRTARYAEALAVALARAIWYLAEPTRASLAVPGDTRARERMRVVAAAGLTRKDVQQLIAEPARQAAALEQVVQATEVEVWRELRASRRRRRDPAIYRYLRS